MSIKKLLKYCLLLLPVLLCVAYIFFNDLTHPHIGDDAMYGEYYPRQFKFLQSFYSMWMNCNARFFDITVRVWLHHCPRGLFAVISAALTGLLFIGYSRLTGITPKRPLLWTFALAGLFLGCPWGDDLQIFVVQINYLWSLSISAFVLSLIFFCDMKSARWLWLLPVAGIAGCGHEILGIPILVGIIAWLRFRRGAPLSIYKKWILAALILGCIFSISSPGSYRRISNLGIASHDESPEWQVALESGYLVLLLAADLLWLLLARRHRLKELCRDIWLPMVCISFTSIIFVVAGNVPGRSGWAVQFFALTALLRQYTLSGRTLNFGRLALPLWLLISTFFSVQWGAIIHWQLRVNSQIADVLAKHAASPDGYVDACYDTEADLPQLLMGRVKPADFEDEWYCEALSKTSGKPVRIRRKSGV